MKTAMLLVGHLILLTTGIALGIWLVAGTDSFEQVFAESLAGVTIESVAIDIPPATSDAAEQPTTQIDQRKILYYRNPMGLPDISYEPKKDWMGMDYLPVYEGEEPDNSGLTVPLGKIQRSGVKSEPARLQTISAPVRAPGTIQLDERLISAITVREEAFIEKVEDVTTGTEVKKGQPLLQIYSPEIVRVAAEYVAVMGMRGTAGIYTGEQGSRQRLLNLGVPEAVIVGIEQTKRVPLVFTLTAPRDGIVLERNVVDGMRAMPGDELFLIAENSKVWAIVDVAERDLSAISPGQPVSLTIRSYPSHSFEGRVALLYPRLDAETRTVRVRIELDNHDLALKPDMYVDAIIDTGDQKPVLAVPQSAVIDSGQQQLVLVDHGEGHFEPRRVQLGRMGGGLAEVLSGLNEGETVVTTGNFLIDAESNLNAAISGFNAGDAP